MSATGTPEDAVQAVHDFLGVIIKRAEGHDYAQPATLRALNDIAWLRGVLHRSLTFDAWAVTASVITAGPEWASHDAATDGQPTSSTT